jgi:hypothetical protein
MSSPKTFTIEDFVLTKYVANSNNGNNIPIKPNAAPLNFALKLLLATTLKQNKYYKFCVISN